VLADRIKKVQDSHLLELIQDVMAEGKRIPPAAAAIPFTRAAAATVNGSFPGNALGASSIPVTFGDHHSEQEDYLWGV